MRIFFFHTSPFHVRCHTLQPCLSTTAPSNDTFHLQISAFGNPINSRFTFHMLYHLSLPRLTTLSTLSIPNPCLSFSHDLLSFIVTPDIHLTILFSVLRSLCISSTFIAQVSLPYTSILCTHALYTFPFTPKEAPLSVSNILSSINFPQAHLTLALEDSSAPPPFSITSPK